MAVDIGALLNNDIHSRLTGKGGLDIVANPAFGGYISNIALHGFRI